MRRFSYQFLFLCTTINPRGFGFQIELNKCINLLWQEFHHMSNCICWISKIYSKKSAETISSLVLTRISAPSEIYAVLLVFNKIFETWHNFPILSFDKVQSKILEQHSIKFNLIFFNRFLVQKISIINSGFPSFRGKRKKNCGWRESKS